MVACSCKPARLPWVGLGDFLIPYSNPGGGKKRRIGSEFPLKTVLVSAAVIIEGQKVLITQRKEGAPYGLFWEFPGGKIEDGEDPREALKRELREELGIEVQVETIWDVTYYVYPEHPVLVLFYLCRIEKGAPSPIGCRDFCWVDGQELGRLPLLPADASLVAGLREKLESP